MKISTKFTPIALGTVLLFGSLASIAKIANAVAPNPGHAWTEVGDVSVTISQGGTGQTTATAAFNALSPLTTKGDLVVHNGTNNIRIGVGSNGQVLTADSTQASGIKWATGGGGSVTSVDGSGGTTGLTLTGGPITTSGTLTLGGTLVVANGGMGITSGNSGGILYFSSSTSSASSAVLAANQIVLGGGAGTAPATLGSLGTTTQVLHGNAGGIPTFAAVSLTADVSGILPVANGGTGQTTATAAFNALSPLTTKGDLVVHNGTNNIRIGVGSNGQVLTADSTQASGIKWATGGGGSVTSVDGSGGTTGLTLTGGPITTSGTLTLGGTLVVANGGMGITSGNSGGILYFSSSTSSASSAVLAANQIVLGGGAGTAPATLGSLGTTTQVLHGNAGGIPTFAAVSLTADVSGILPVANGGTGSASGAPGAFLGTRTLTSGTTYSPTAGTTAIVVRLVGGGGGGGGGTGSITNCQAGGGGGSGSYAEKYWTGISSATTYTIAIGGGGTGGVAAGGTGGTGGNTTFACDASCAGGAVTCVTANGGNGGPATAGGTLGTAAGGAGGAVSTNGNLNATGQPGNPAFCLSGALGNSGAGAPSHFGGGGNSLAAQAAGNAGGNFGSGGGGALSTSTAANAGGAGAPGVIVVWEFR